MSNPRPPLLLASGSPRRRDLLEEAGYEFQVEPPGIEELEDTTVPIRELTAENARRKAEAVADRFPERVVIAADTLVLVGDTVLSKPADREEARRMLASLSGTSHQVFTAVTLVRRSPQKEVCLTVSTDVHFRTLDEDEIRAYHDKIDPMDKAGAYAAQEHGRDIIERVEGSMTNVIGLPMDEVGETLRVEFGIEPG